MTTQLINSILYTLDTTITLPGTVVAVTGHRPHKLGGDYTFVSPLMRGIRNRLQGYIRQLNPDYMISGMALGIDTLWAQLALINKIPLIAAVPCVEQYVRWPASSQELYHKILKQARMVINTSGQLAYTSSCMQHRNIWMVDHCTHLIDVWDGSPGGTANCVQYAQGKLGKNKIIHVDPTTILV